MESFKKFREKMFGMKAGTYQIANRKVKVTDNNTFWGVYWRKKNGKEGYEEYPKKQYSSPRKLLKDVESEINHQDKR